MKAVIQNADALALTPLRRDALAIASAGYAAINTGGAVKRLLRLEGDDLSVGTTVYRLAERRVYFVGIGKCAIAAGCAIEAVLGEKLAGGIALDVSDIEQSKLKTIEAYIGTHPLPSEVNGRATKRIMEFLGDRREDDLVIMLVSGGGSTLLCLPCAPMTCTDERLLFETMTARGAPIRDLNIVRKHISRARGGGLMAAAYPAEVVSLIISDVPGDDLSLVASGPTVFDTSTVADAQAVVHQYGMDALASATFVETPKDPAVFGRVTNLLLLSSRDALSAMREEAERRGYRAVVADTHFSGEAREVGRAAVEKLHESASQTALLYAGESTVTLGEDAGAGGRNQEMALAALQYLNPDELLLPFTSDGHDNTAHAGAIADDLSRAHARERNVSPQEYVSAHRSYDFFKTTGDALLTGYTGSNVSDLIVALKQ